MSERSQGDAKLPVWVKTVAILIWFIPLFISLISPDTLSFDSWASMSLSGVSMGVLIFLIAVGLTVIFGLMDVLNFAHGIFFTVGAFVCWKLFTGPLAGWVEEESLMINIMALLLGILVSAVVTFLMGILMERLIIRKTYGDHLKQILITMGVMIIIEELVRIFGSPDTESFPTPVWFMDSFEIGDILILRYQVLSIIVGMTCYGLILWLLNRTKIGLIVRAGVENPNMIKAMGYHLNRVFTIVFAFGAVLAGIGGVMWAGFNESVDASMGGNTLIFAFIVVIIGGLGSVSGSLLGAILVGLSFNYFAFFIPQIASASLILLMCCILMLKPKGLFPQK